MAHSGRVFDSTSDASSQQTKRTAKKQPIRITLQPVAPELYAVAFVSDIGLPKRSERWEELHSRGGVDAAESDLRLVLTNPTEEPATITNVEAITTASRPAPTDSLAYVYTQGAAELEQFGVELNSELVGTKFTLRRQEGGIPTMSPSLAPAFFERHHITLASGEVYEAKIQVDVRVLRELEYEFVVSGNTADGAFSYRATPKLKITGRLRSYAHEYWNVPEANGGWCWMRTDLSLYTEPVCPGASGL